MAILCPFIDDTSTHLFWHSGNVVNAISLISLSPFFLPVVVLQSDVFFLYYQWYIMVLLLVALWRNGFVACNVYLNKFLEIHDFGQLAYGQPHLYA